MVNWRVLAYELFALRNPLPTEGYMLAGDVRQRIAPNLERDESEATEHGLDESFPYSQQQVPCSMY